MNALCVVAHPDDELLFAGALIDYHPEWTWTLVSLTASAQADRYPGIVLGHDDVWRILTVPEYREWKSSLAGLGLSPDVVFTHNQMGEYGHPHHMTVHAIVHELFPNVWDFLVDAPSSIGPQMRDRAIVEVPTDGKRERFVARYGEDVLATLTVHQPDLIHAVFTRECFTGRGAWPS